MTDLNLGEEDFPFPHEEVREGIGRALDRCPMMPENLCIHGYNVLIKGKTLKRRSTILKHSRFLRNLSVEPIYPPEPEPVPEVNEDGEGEGEEVEDE